LSWEVQHDSESRCLHPALNRQPGRDLPLDKIKLPPGFTISLYADNVPGARSMALSPDGTLFVGSRGSSIYALPNRSQVAR